ncbi:MAG: LptE family protein [bacterium]
MSDARYDFRKTACLLVSISVLICGCGIYSFSGSNVPGHIKNVAVPLFEDKTAEFGIDRQMTDALIDAITQDNTLKISGVQNADAVLKGEILRVEDRAGQYDNAEKASDFRITLTIKMTFEDTKKRKILWEETWSQWGSYDNTGLSREDGIKQAVDKLSRDILNKTVSGW